MFELFNVVAEVLFGCSSTLSNECFESLSTHLQIVVCEILQQSFSIALRSKRTRLLIADFQSVLKCRSLSPLFGYCCSSTRNPFVSCEIVQQDGRTLFVQTDLSIDCAANRLERAVHFDSSSTEILIHVELLAVTGEQSSPPLKCSLLKKSLLNKEQQLYLSFLQSSCFNEEIWQVLSDQPVALETILPSLTEWLRTNIYECLIHNVREQKRRHLAHFLTIIDSLLHHPSAKIDHYLSAWLPMLMTCLLYRFELDESPDGFENLPETSIDTSQICSIRLQAARACLKILKRSEFFLYDVFFLRIIGRLLFSLTNVESSSSLVYSILFLFDQLGTSACHAFLLPHLFQIDQSKLFSSKSIVSLVESLAIKMLEM